MLTRHHGRDQSLALLLCFMGFVLPVFADPVVVVPRHSPIESITLEEAANVFLGKTFFLHDGTKVIPVDQSADSPTRNLFYRRVAGKSPRQLKAYWAKIIFSGKGKPPKAVGDADAIKEWLENHSDAISYIDSEEVDDRVKVVLRVQ